MCKSKQLRQISWGVIILMGAVLFWLSAVSRPANADGKAETPIKVHYQGADTTFEALSAAGKEVHCVTELTPDLTRRRVFDAQIDRVLCFDTIAEADKQFASMHPSFRRHVQSESGKLTNQATGCSSRFALFYNSGYNGWWADLCSDRSYVTLPIWSIWEHGTAAMRVYKDIWYSGSSWLIAESHWTLSNNWGGREIRSIDWY